MMPPKKIADIGKLNCHIGNKERRRKMGGMRVEVEDKWHFCGLSEILTGQGRKEPE